LAERGEGELGISARKLTPARGPPLAPGRSVQARQGARDNEVRHGRDGRDGRDEGDGKSTTTLYRAKAYPGTRFLQVAKEVRESGIVGSICATNLDDPYAADFGYRPAVATIVDRLSGQLSTRCLPRKLEPNPDGSTPCLIVEARFPREAGVVNNPAAVEACRLCKDPSGFRSQVPPDLLASLGSGVGDSYDCLCRINELSDSPGAQDRTECQTVVDLPALTSGHGGWCYVDPESEPDGARREQASQVVAPCPVNEPRTIRFVGGVLENTTLLIACAKGSGGPPGAVPSPAAGPAGEDRW
jgi:hypothetical protein